MQLSFIENKKTIKWHLHIDGASRGNPGLAGAGICLTDQESQIIKKGVFLGIKTNNQAEYFSLLFGLLIAKKTISKDDEILIHADSDLLVKQIKGQYSIKNKSLYCLYNHAKAILKNMNYKIVHVYREHNTIADKYANLAIDKRLKVPDELLNDWLQYEHCI